MSGVCFFQNDGKLPIQCAKDEFVRHMIHSRRGTGSGIQHHRGTERNFMWKETSTSRCDIGLPLRTLLRLILCLVLVTLSSAFQIGTNVTLTFIHTLTRQDVVYTCDALIVGVNQPFFFQNEIDPHGLKPGQKGRFSVKLHQAQRNLAIVISITNLQKIDEGGYVVIVTETTDGRLLPASYQTSVAVSFPPGKAKCEVRNPHLSGSDWLTVQCNATAGSNGHGYLVCLQDSKRLPYLQPEREDGDQMTSTFWFDPKQQMQCCSGDSDSMTDIDLCSDFVYMDPHHEAEVSSINPNSVTYQSTSSPLPHGGGLAISGLYVAIAILSAGTVVLAAILVFMLQLWRKTKTEAGERVDERETLNGDLHAVYILASVKH